MTRQKQRLLRQISALERKIPRLRGPLRGLVDDRWAGIRIPLAVALMFGGIFSVLPVLGLWMLPLGLMLLALDVPALQPCVARLFIGVRRMLRRRRRDVKRR